MALLVDRGERSFPGQVEADPGLVGVEHQVDPLQRFEHLDPVRSDREVEALVVERVGAPHDVLQVAAPHYRVRVLHPELRVDAGAGDEEDLAGPVVGVEVAPVVEVPVAARDVPHRQRRLVQRVFVECYGHVATFQIPSRSASNDSRCGRLCSRSSGFAGISRSPKCACR